MRRFLPLQSVFLRPFVRVYLKTVNMPKQWVFSRCAAPFFLEIHPVFPRQNGLHNEKIPYCWAHFQFSDRR